MAFIGKYKENWMKKYNLLKKYYEIYKNTDISPSFEFESVKLGMWLHTQRKLYKNSKLTKEQIQLLNNLEVIWNPREEKWDEKYYLLEEYYKEHGNIDIPKAYITKDGVHLGEWLYTQKCAYNGIGNWKITPDHIILLEDLKIDWNVMEDKWSQYYNLLQEYKDEYGNIDVPQIYEIDGMKLGSWLSDQKRSYKGKGTYKSTKERRKLLNELDIDWSVKDTKTLNSEIKEENIEIYNKVLLERLKHILEDLSDEGLNEIKNTDDQKEIEKIIIKRMWR